MLEFCTQRYVCVCRSHFASILGLFLTLVGVLSTFVGLSGLSLSFSLSLSLSFSLSFSLSLSLSVSLSDATLMGESSTHSCL